MEYKLNFYTLRENRPMKVETFSQLISTSLYEKRFYKLTLLSEFEQVGALLRPADRRGDRREGEQLRIDLRFDWVLD